MKRIVTNILLICAIQQHTNCSIIPTLPIQRPDVTLSFTQKFQIEFIRQEIQRYPDLFINDWTKNNSVALVIDSAELAIQNSSVQTQPIMKQLIVNLFKTINISIEFTDENLIFRTNNVLQKHVKFHPLKHPKRHYTPITQWTPLQPARIKGGRRTLKKMKKRLAQQKQEELAQKIADLNREKRLYIKLEQQKKLREQPDYEISQEYVKTI